MDSYGEGVGIILLDLSRDKNKSTLFRNFFMGM